jgi:hypothetical protein
MPPARPQYVHNKDARPLDQSGLMAQGQKQRGRQAYFVRNTPSGQKTEMVQSGGILEKKCMF